MRTFTPSEAFAHRLRAIRSQQGLTTQELADRLDATGFAIQRNAITKIETQKGRTSVTLEEVLAFAVALQTPVAVLLAPIDVADAEVMVTPRLSWNPWLYLDALMTGRDAGSFEWPFGERIAELYLQLRTHQGEIESATRQLKEAAFVDDDKLARSARRDTVRALKDLDRTIEELRGHGLATGEGLVVDEWRELAEQAGVNL